MSSWNETRNPSGNSIYNAPMHHPGAEHAREVAKRCREKPGEWFDLAVGRTHGPAASRASAIRSKRPPLAFRPAGAYEAREEKRDDGHAVVVRFVGWPGTPP